MRWKKWEFFVWFVWVLGWFRVFCGGGGLVFFWGGDGGLGFFLFVFVCLFSFTIAIIYLSTAERRNK